MDKYVEFQGKLMTITELGRLVGIDHKLLFARIRSGKSLEESLYKPLKKLNKRCPSTRVVKVRKSYFDGASKTTCSEYLCWWNMTKRCNDPINKSYHRYGGRGITVCEEWLVFENFVRDMGRRPSYKYSIERKDNSLGYSKDNCYWGTPKEQNNNRRDNKIITYQNKSQSAQMWADELKIPRYVLVSRLSRGWSIEKAFSEPLDKRRSHKIIRID